MKKAIFVISIGLIFAAGCTPVSVDSFKDAGPSFVLEEYFEGKTRAWGLFEDRMGNVRREFVVDISGQWDGSTLTLSEDFIYNDGETETRVWKITKTGAHDYEGTTREAPGKAVGKSAGNAFFWDYDFNLKVGDGTWKVHFDDRMFLQPDGVLLNTATVSRWGFKIGTVFLSFTRIPTTDAAVSSKLTPSEALEPA
jgi:hypothetical protein